jgi:transcriptional regulator with XRE-family HTH domain
MDRHEIARRRTALGRSRPDLARAAGISPATMWRIETGRTEPSSLALRAIAAALDELERKQARNARDRAARAAKAARTR